VDARDAQVGRLLSAVLAGSHAVPPDELERLVTEAAVHELGASDVVLLLQDYDQNALYPLRAAATAGDEDGASIDGTLAGRAFSTSGVVTAAAEGGTRVWAALLDGTTRLGVLGLVLPEVDERLEDGCQRLASLTAEILASKDTLTDLYKRVRRRQPMTLAAEMQWQLLPPLTVVTPRVALSGVVEPAYEVGGDAFDYAVNGDIVHLAIVDAMGHGTRASIMSTVAIGAYRNARRSVVPLAEKYAAMDAALSAHFGADSFATAQMARLDVVTGEIQLVNAGHPPPLLLLRDSHVVREIVVPPTLPVGFGGGTPDVHVESLQPGDKVLFYTDGVVEERGADGEIFGLERLVDHVTRALTDERSLPETIRVLSAALLRARDGRTSDDATLLMVEWPGPDAPDLPGGDVVP
jgi:serine phosphatase RsbU (regulator of sigma subunit)